MKNIVKVDAQVTFEKKEYGQEKNTKEVKTNGTNTTREESNG